MGGSRYALVVLIWSLGCSSAIGQSLAPEAGLLVLKNGQVIEGDVTRAGDFYVVTRGEGIELRLKADDVECFCASLAEAYEFKARRLTGISARPHLELARWCLRNGLTDECRQQLEAADRSEPGDSQVKELMTRLTVMQQKPPEAPLASTVQVVPVEKVEKTIAELPRGSVERFGAVVQPILLNRCAANQCHGPNSKSEFRLLRPPPGQIVSRRFTQRNLYTTLRQLDPSSPDRSPLVIKAEQRHGSTLTPVFDKQSANQLAELVAWARMATGPAPAATSKRPASISPGPATLSQPATMPMGSSASAAAAAPLSPGSPVINQGELQAVVHVKRPAVDTEGGKSEPEQLAPPLPATPGLRDRFDPEIFNRRYHRP